ncbi:pseudouridine synthase [Sphingomonas spermidinifaciens]|uniref:pseudouridine synthase n=1 Tax=Sphingomonas spermidinifaciens TaxID=1141889 RepID=UPI002481AD7C|nr:pseudouridine synthase [Sphingomonas spermidinifaciens]
MSKPPEQHRIAKLLARAGIASRREIERMIEDRRIAIDGLPVETPATILSNLRGVTVDGQPVAAPAPARLFRFHKPAGVLTAERDFSGRRTIYDVLPRDMPRVVPVGRLDLNTEGLLLLTTDGELKRALELPATKVKRTYRARAFGEISQAQLEDLIEGIEIEGVRYGSIDANLERRTGANVWVEMTLTEGKNREVRRVLEHLGLRVSRLIRTSYGPVPLADMPVGAVDEVRQHDLIQFRRELKLPADKRSDTPLVTSARPVKAERDEEAPVERTPRRPSAAPAERGPRRAPGAARPAAVRKREQPERLETDRRRLPGRDAQRGRPSRDDVSPDAATPVRNQRGKPRRTSDSKFGAEKPRVERPRHPGERTARGTATDRGAGTLSPRAEGDRAARTERPAKPRTGSSRSPRDEAARPPRGERPAGGRPPRGDGSPRRPGSRPGGPRKGPR